MVVSLSQQEKVKNEICSSQTIKVLACREVNFNFLGILLVQTLPNNVRPNLWPSSLPNQAVFFGFPGSQGSQITSQRG